MLKNLDGDNKEFQQTLVYCALMVGLRPEKFEIDIVIKYLLSEHKTLCIEDLIKAFQQNSSGRNWTTIEHYGCFSTLFVGKICRNFEDHKRKEEARRIKALPEPEKKDIITHEEAKPMLEKMAKELKRLDLKFKIKSKR